MKATKASTISSRSRYWSRCSRSMLVTTAREGRRQRNDLSLSSASTTINSPLPSRALEPNASSRPPMTAVGSRPACASITAIIEVVVVFPCAPATAMENFSRISSANISARGITGTFSRPASRISGLSGRTADEITTTSAPRTFSARCPSKTRAPSRASRAVTARFFPSASWAASC